MKLVTVDCVVGGRPGAVLDSGEILYLERALMQGSTEAWLPNSMRGILEAGPEGLDLVRRIVSRAHQCSEAQRNALREHGALLPGNTRLLAPVPNPTMTLSIGQAYHSHVREMNGKGKPPSEPHAFLKSPAAITAHNADIQLPPQRPDMVDFEGELCAVVGQACHNVSEADAMQYIAGYTITNDVSARDSVHLVQSAQTTPEARHAWDLVHMEKQFPGFAPMGPVMVTADTIQDVGNLDLTTRVNGEIMQQANTADLIFTLAQVIAYFSHWYSFSPGDIISTGTPGGVGFGRDPKVLLRPGDVVEIEVSSIGTLSNRFVAAAA